MISPIPLAAAKNTRADVDNVNVVVAVRLGFIAWERVYIRGVCTRPACKLD